MKKNNSSKIAKTFACIVFFAAAASPVLANTVGSTNVNAEMSPAAVVGSVALILGSVLLLATKGARRPAH